VPDAGQKPELIPELARHAQAEKLLPRMSASPFLDEVTRTTLSATGRKTLIICGFATEVVVLHAARAALDADFRVFIPVDACGGMSARTEDATFRQMEVAGVINISVVGVVTAMAPDFGAEPGQQAFQMLQTLRLA
jgi:nicotinamidase-related amidase